MKVTLSRAIAVAARLHDGQVDKAGAPDAGNSGGSMCAERVWWMMLLTAAAVVALPTYGQDQTVARLAELAASAKGTCAQAVVGRERPNYFVAQVCLRTGNPKTLDVRDDKKPRATVTVEHAAGYTSSVGDWQVTFVDAKSGKVLKRKRFSYEEAGLAPCLLEPGCLATFGTVVMPKPWTPGEYAITLVWAHDTDVKVDFKIVILP